LTQIETSEITLNLKDGINVLKVSTNLPCQGSYDEEIYVSNEPIIYPNPFTESTSVFLGTELAAVDVIIHTADGRLVGRKRYAINGNEIELDFVGFPSGMYFVSLIGERLKETFKVIKR